MDYTSQDIVDQEVRKRTGSQYCSYQNAVGDIEWRMTTRRRRRRRRIINV